MLLVDICCISIVGGDKLFALIQTCFYKLVNFDISKAILHSSFNRDISSKPFCLFKVCKALNSVEIHVIPNHHWVGSLGLVDQDLSGVEATFDLRSDLFASFGSGSWQGCNRCAFVHLSIQWDKIHSCFPSSNTSRPRRYLYLRALYRPSPFTDHLISLGSKRILYSVPILSLIRWELISHSLTDLNIRYWLLQSRIITFRYLLINHSSIGAAD